MTPITDHIARNGSVGQLIPGVIARVMTKDKTLAAAGERGELIVTGPQMALGYMNDVQA